MDIPVSAAKGQLSHLVRRAEAGDDIVLTRHGHPAVRLVPVKAAHDLDVRHQSIVDIRAAAAIKVRPGPDAAHSQDFLFGNDGLPG